MKESQRVSPIGVEQCNNATHGDGVFAAPMAFIASVIGMTAAGLGASNTARFGGTFPFATNCKSNRQRGQLDIWPQKAVFCSVC